MKYFVLIAVIVLALLALLVGRLPGLWRLNRTALQTAGFMAASDLTPGWWLETVPTGSCEAAPSFGLLPASSVFAGRQSRLQGLIDLACGDREQAEAHFQQAVRADYADPTLALLVRLASVTPQAAGSEVLAGPTDWGVAVEQARQAFQQDDNKTAMRLLDGVQAAITEPAQPDRRNLYFWACAIYRSGRRLEASLVACQRLTEVSPESKEAWNSLGLTLLAQRRWQEAEQSFGRAVALDDRWPTALVNLGRALVAQERQAEAHPYFEKAVSIVPDEPWANYYLALDALAAGQCQAARTYAQVVAGSDNARLAGEAQKLLDKDLKACK